MRRQIISGFTMSRTALVIASAFLAVSNIRAPLMGLPKSAAVTARHYYEIASLDFIRDGDDRDLRAEEIAEKIGKNICKTKFVKFDELYQQDNPSREILYITAVSNRGSKDIELGLHVSWEANHGEEQDLPSVTCSNTPADICLGQRMGKIVEEVLQHDCNVHKGANSCTALQR